MNIEQTMVVTELFGTHEVLEIKDDGYWTTIKCAYGWSLMISENNTGVWFRDGKEVFARGMPHNLKKWFDTDSNWIPDDVITRVTGRDA